MNILVTGGVRSGKSRHAESLLADAGPVTYVAAGPATEDETDPDWAARIAAHRARRPDTWTTLETHDLTEAMRTPGPVLIDCLGTWLTAVIDERELWERPVDEVVESVHALLTPALDLLGERTDVVIVTNEVGLGVVPAHRSGRLFRDVLGLVNQEVGAACDAVHLVVAGRVLALP